MPEELAPGAKVDDPDLDALLDELYTLPRQRFVGRRDALVRDLRARGLRDRARQVAALRRPTAAAEALNRLARSHPGELHAYLELGPQLVTAQQAMLRDPEARPAYEALDEDRRQRLTDLLRRAGDRRDFLERALTAALADPRLAAAIESGRLAWVPEPDGGFGALFAGVDVEQLAPRARRPRVDPRAQARHREAEEAEREARAAVAAAKAELERLRRELRGAEHRLLDAERRAQQANEARRRAERG